MIPTLVTRLTTLGNGDEGTCPSVALSFFRRAAYGSLENEDESLTPIQTLLFNAGECVTRAMIEGKLSSQLTSHLLLTKVGGQTVPGVPSLLFSMSERGAKSLHVHGPLEGGRSFLKGYLTAVDSFVKRQYPQVTASEQGRLCLSPPSASFSSTAAAASPAPGFVPVPLEGGLQSDLETRYAWARQAAATKGLKPPLPCSSSSSSSSSSASASPPLSFSPSVSALLVEAKRPSSNILVSSTSKDNNEIDLDDKEGAEGEKDDNLLAGGASGDNASSPSASSCLCFLVRYHAPMRVAPDADVASGAKQEKSKIEQPPSKRRRLESEDEDKTGATADSEDDSSPSASSDSLSSGDGIELEPNGKAAAAPASAPGFELCPFSLLFLDVPLATEDGIRALSRALSCEERLLKHCKGQGVLFVVHLVSREVWRSPLYQSLVVTGGVLGVLEGSECRHFAVSEQSASSPLPTSSLKQRYSHFPSLMRQTIELSKAAPELFLPPFPEADNTEDGDDGKKTDGARNEPSVVDGESGILLLKPLHQFQLGSRGAVSDRDSKGGVFRQDAAESDEKGAAESAADKAEEEPERKGDAASAQHPPSSSPPDDDAPLAPYFLAPSMWILGTGAAAPSKRRSCSGILVSTGSDSFLLLDAGEGCLGRLEMLASSWRVSVASILRHLRAVWVSHLHADHHSGLLSLMREFALAVGLPVQTSSSSSSPLLSSQACLTITGPPALAPLVECYKSLLVRGGETGRSEEATAQLFSFVELPRFDAQAPSLIVSPEVSSSVSNSLLLRRFRTVRVDHSCRDAYGCVLTFEKEKRDSNDTSSAQTSNEKTKQDEGGEEGSGKRKEPSPSCTEFVALAYSGDTVPCQALVDAVRDAAKEAVVTVLSSPVVAAAGGPPPRHLVGAMMTAPPFPQPTAIMMGTPMMQTMMPHAWPGAATAGLPFHHNQQQTPQAAAAAAMMMAQLQQQQQQQQLLWQQQQLWLHQQQRLQSMSAHAVSSSSSNAAASSSPSSSPVFVRCFLVHEATMDDDRADDARKKKHSTVGGALSVKKRIEEALAALQRSLAGGSGSSSTTREISLRLAGTVLTHFSQRYPSFPAPAVSSSSFSSSSSSSALVSGSKRKLGDGASSSSSSSAVVAETKEAAAGSDGAAAVVDSAADTSADGSNDRDRDRARTLFAFDGMIVPLLNDSPFERSGEIWAAIAARLEKD